jgi:hypothetical protein
MLERCDDPNLLLLLAALVLVALPWFSFRFWFVGVWCLGEP